MACRPFAPWINDPNARFKWSASRHSGFHQPLFRIPSLILLFLQAHHVISTCYGGDNNHTAESDIYTPCNQNTPFSMCIRTQVVNGFPPDTRCLPNGLVISPINGQQFWRQGCTDFSWESDYCLKAFNACPNDAGGNAIVTSCSGYSDSTTWCCGDGNTACCGQAGAITIAATIGPAFTSSSAVLSATSSSSVVLTTSSSSVAVTTSSSSVVVTTSSSSVAVTTSSTSLSSVSPISINNGTTLSVGAEAGISVGVSLAGLAIIGGIIWITLRRRRRRRELADRTGHDVYFQKPELHGNTTSGWEGEEAAKRREPQARNELDTGVDLLIELPAG